MDIPATSQMWFYHLKLIADHLYITSSYCYLHQSSYYPNMLCYRKLSLGWAATIYMFCKTGNFHNFHGAGSFVWQEHFVNFGKNTTLTQICEIAEFSCTCRIFLHICCFTVISWVCNQRPCIKQSLDMSSKKSPFEARSDLDTSKRDCG